jgi:light-regulated signal transduction histidine kinase (bacteriophytochrome)
VSQAGPSSDDAIQPIGFLVALAPDWRVSRLSANIGDHLGVPAASLLHQPVTNLFAQDAVHSLRNRLALLRSPASVERLYAVPLTGTGSQYDIALHMSGTTVVIEAEPSRDHRHDHDSTGTICGMIAQLGPIAATPDFFALAARHMRALTGFDRVLIRRYGAGATETVGEAVRNGAQSLAAAGQAMRSDDGRTILTIIPDTAADPIAILAPSEARQGRLDLSHAMLLAAPPARQAALRKSGVGAAIEVPLVIAGRHWGEIICHHRAPACPSFERRSAIEWFAMMLGMQIEIRELKARLEAAA